MSLALGTGESAEPVDGELLSWKIEGKPLEIRIHPDVIEGITRDILAVPEGEVDGALRGRRQPGDTEIVWIEEYRRLTSASDSPDDAIGFYRGTAAKAGFPDSDGPPDSFLMTVSPDSSGALTARFFLPGGAGELEPMQPGFPFRTRTHGKPRRLVPDFDSTAQTVHPARDFFMQSRPLPEEPDDFGADAGGVPALLRRFWPLLAVAALVGAAVWLLPPILSKQVVAPSAAPQATATRPLGLYVDPSGPAWRISWNRDASVLHGASLVRLFIHDGDEQNRIDLSPADLESGMYRFEPRGNDVTFRMEATGPEGKVAAESFRLVKTSANAAAPPAPNAARKVAATKITAPQATHRVAPVVAAGIRPQIRGQLTIDVRVQVDSRGRVTSAVPAKHPHSRLEISLAASAVRAARAWRFDPALRDGKPVTGTQTLHFVFER
jgi:TonB family protein